MRDRRKNSYRSPSRGGLRAGLRAGLLLSGILLPLVIVIGAFLSAKIPAKNPPLQIAEEGISKTTAETPVEAATSNTGDIPAADTPKIPETETAPPETEDTVPVYSDKSDDDKISEYIASLTLREKVCQMMIVTLDALTGVAGANTAGQKAQARIEEYPVGGIIHFKSNITSKEQISLLNKNIQSYAKTPMFISVDEEGGRVGRLKTAIGAHSLSAMLSYEQEGEARAADNARILADALRQYGFNTDFAPVADVWSNPQNTVIGDRAYSTDFDSAAALVKAAVNGFNESNIVCALKHFPGHGDTMEDSHNGTAYVNKDIEELRDAELKPFAAGIAAGADMVMMGHLVIPSMDTLPATLSGEIIGILRKELGFDGVVITDSLAMNAISSIYTTEYVAVTAVSSGVDILLMPNGVERTIAALTAAVADGRLSEERIDESVFRIISLKVLRGIMQLS